MIVERTSGKPLREFAAEQLFEPLGMNNTLFDDTPNSTNVGWHAMERVLPRIADLCLADEMVLDDSEQGQGEPEWNDNAPPVELRSARGYLEFGLRFAALAEAGETSSNSDDRPAVLVNYKNGDEQSWEPVQFVTHVEEELQDYVGEYYCDDLESVYRVSTNDGKLFVQFNFGRKRLYRPTLGDAFIPAKERFVIPIEFSRDQSGTVTKFKTGFDRTGDLIFKRRVW